jgi:hypothetical protein
MGRGDKNIHFNNKYKSFGKSLDCLSPYHGASLQCDFIKHCFTVEIVCIVLLKSRLSERTFADDFSEDLLRFSSGWREMATGSIWLQVLRKGAFILALAIIACFAYRFVTGFGTIFNQWDDLVSWNRWAIDWYNGRFPTLTWHYPQLLPSVWSITYKAIGTSDIQFFAKGLMGLFPLLIFIILFDLWLRTNAVGFLAGIPITAFLLLFANGVNVVGSGYADVPVAFMAFVPLYLLLTTANESWRLERVLLVGTLVTAGAALTKQAGLFILVLYPLISWYLIRINTQLHKVPVARIISHFLIAVALVLPWYAITEYRISEGNEKSEIKMVTVDIHQGRGAAGRFVDIQRKVEELVRSSPRLEQITTILGASIIDGVKVTYVILVTIIFLAMLSIRDPLWRLPALTIMLPFTGVWILFYSYDFRNLSLALPYIGAGAGLTLLHYFELAAKRLPVFRFSGRVLTTLILVVLAGSATIIDKSYLMSKQLKLMREVGIPEINRFIYSLLAEEAPGVIITNYQPIRYLPGLDGKYINDLFADAQLTAVNIASPEAKYLLIFLPELNHAAVKSALSSLEVAGRINRLADPCSGFSLYRLKKQ